MANLSRYVVGLDARREQRVRTRADGISEQIAAKHKEAQREYLKAHAVPGCELCQELIEHIHGPSHNGRPWCESGSIASGGKESHCACDVCF